MKTARLLIGFGNYSDSKLDKKTGTIYNSMIGNAYFPKPSPALSTILSSWRNYQEALAQAATKASEKVALKKVARQALIDNLVKLASYVTFVAQGDRVKLLSSGFSVSRESDNPKPLGDVENFQVIVGKVSAQATLKCKKVIGATSYNFYYQLQTAINGPWFHGSNTIPRYTFIDLPILQLVCFKMTALGAGGVVTSSEIITKGVV